MATLCFRTFIDLRFFLPSLINLSIDYYLSSQKEDLFLYWVNMFLNFPLSTLILTVLLFLAISVIIFTSITIPFVLTLENRLTLQLGHFSLAWTALFIASFILSPGVFFSAVFPVTILISPYQELIFKSLRLFFGWLLHTLRRFSGVDVICRLNDPYRDENDTQPPEPPQLESPESEIASAQDQPNLVHELEIITEE